MDRPRLSLPCLLLITLFLLAACGSQPPTATPVPAPTATPAPPPPPAYLAQVDFNFADQAEQADRTLVTSRPDFPAYASWTQSSHWYVLARDSSSDRLRAKVGPDARILPVTYMGDALGGTTAAFPVYTMILNRASVDVKANGAQETTRLLFNRAIGQVQNRAGILMFTVGEDQIYVVVAASYPAEKVLSLASFGKLEMIDAGTKQLADGAIVATSASPRLGALNLTDKNIYNTVAENSDFSSFQANPASALGTVGLLNFEVRPGSKIFDFSRDNRGKYTALLFDRQVLTSAQIAQPIKDKGQIEVKRWVGSSGHADMLRFVDLVNANPPQLFEARELNKSGNFVFSGSFIR